MGISLFVQPGFVVCGVFLSTELQGVQSEPSSLTLGSFLTPPSPARRKCSFTNESNEKLKWQQKKVELESAKEPSREGEKEKIIKKIQDKNAAITTCFHSLLSN